MPDRLRLCNSAVLNPSQKVQVAVPGRKRNLLECLQGYPTCDHSVLTSEQAVQIDRLDHERNLLACETDGILCDKSMLTSSEAQDVTALEHQRNLLECQTGDTSCNPLLLTSSEFKQVDDAKHERNLLACESGADECDPYLLDGAEAKEVAIVQKSRTRLHNATADTLCDSSASITSSDQTQHHRSARSTGFTGRWKHAGVRILSYRNNLLPAPKKKPAFDTTKAGADLLARDLIGGVQRITRCESCFRWLLGPRRCGTSGARASGEFPTWAMSATQRS